MKHPACALCPGAHAAKAPGGLLFVPSLLSGAPAEVSNVITNTEDAEETKLWYESSQNIYLVAWLSI